MVSQNSRFSHFPWIILLCNFTPDFPLRLKKNPDSTANVFYYLPVFSFFRIHHERLEVEPNANSDMDFSKIVKDNKTVCDKTTKQEEKINRITEPKEDSFVDDPDVPPLM